MCVGINYIYVCVCVFSMYVCVFTVSYGGRLAYRCGLFNARSCLLMSDCVSSVLAVVWHY